METLTLPFRALGRRLAPVFAPLTQRLPTEITRVTKWIAWASLIANIGIILTGGAVRLTDSGLGCPEWPLCTEDSIVATPEMGIHGAIEFGNRMLTYVLIAIAAAMLLSVIRLRRTHRPLVAMSLIIVAGIPIQAVIGGITVWTNLNPWVVALHFLASAGLVMVATWILGRVNLELRTVGATGTPLVDGPTDRTTRLTGWVILASAWAAVVLGTVVTGTGPHAGDPGSPRHDFDPNLVTQLHVVPVYILCAATVVLMVRNAQLKASPAQRRAGWFLLAVIVLQGIVGYWQHFTGLPIQLVWVHMLGSALTVVAAANVWDRILAPYRTRGLGDPTAPRAEAAEPALR
ncbi:COX15/CtaA family protein [Nesterenkonia populi]